MSPDVDHMDTATQGGNVFAVRLLVPLERLANATRLIPASKRGGIPAAAGPSAAKHSQPLP
jgi:hypothetical protein